MNPENRNFFAVLSAVVVACPSLCCLLAGVGILIGEGTYTLDANTLPRQTIPPPLGIPLLCLGMLVWLLPVGVWLVAGRRSAASPAAGAPAGSSPGTYSPFQHPWEEAGAGPAAMDDDAGSEM